MSQKIARENALKAALECAVRRQEREDVERFLRSIPPLPRIPGQPAKVR